MKKIKSKFSLGENITKNKIKMQIIKDEKKDSVRFMFVWLSLEAKKISSFRSHKNFRASKIRVKIWAIWEPYANLTQCSPLSIVDTNFDSELRFGTLIPNPFCNLLGCFLHGLLLRVQADPCHGFGWIRREPWRKQSIGINKRPRMKLLVKFVSLKKLVKIGNFLRYLLI